MIEPTIVRSARAEQDIDEIAFYLAERSETAGHRFLNAVESAIQRLARNPTLGRLRDFRNPAFADIRSQGIAGFRKYLVFYRRIPDGIQVIRVIHGARDLDALFGQPRPSSDDADD